MQAAAHALGNVSGRILNTDVPQGMWAATADVVSSVPQEVRQIRQTSAQLNTGEDFDNNNKINNNNNVSDMIQSSNTTATRTQSMKTKNAEIQHKPSESSSGNNFSPMIDTSTNPKPSSFRLFLISFWGWLHHPLNILILIYGLNVIAWGGMLFLLLCNASPAMCSHDVPDGCNDINSPRRVWIERDSQILNALFCVTGFGLAPWRFRDLFWLLRWRLTREKKVGYVNKMRGLRVLAGIHSSWFRLPGSETMDELSKEEYLVQIGKDHAREAYDMYEKDDPRVPIWPKKLKTLPTTIPLTGNRAPPTKLWILDFVIWFNVWNTFFQCCLCGFMWGMNRYRRPSWSTGLFVALACIVAGVAGVVMFRQGKAVKKIEGIPSKSDTVQGDYTNKENIPIQSKA